MTHNDFFLTKVNKNLVILGYKESEITATLNDVKTPRGLEIYEAYQSFVKKQLLYGKEKAQFPDDFKRARLASQEKSK